MYVAGAPESRTAKALRHRDAAPLLDPVRSRRALHAGHGCRGGSVPRDRLE